MRTGRGRGGAWIGGGVHVHVTGIRRQVLEVSRLDEQTAVLTCESRRHGGIALERGPRGLLNDGPQAFHEQRTKGITVNLRSVSGSEHRQHVPHGEHGQILLTQGGVRDDRFNGGEAVEGRCIHLFCEIELKGSSACRSTERIPVIHRIDERRMTHQHRTACTGEPCVENIRRFKGTEAGAQQTVARSELVAHGVAKADQIGLQSGRAGQRLVVDEEVDAGTGLARPAKGRIKGCMLGVGFPVHEHPLTGDSNDPRTVHVSSRHHAFTALPLCVAKTCINQRCNETAGQSLTERGRSLVGQGVVVSGQIVEREGNGLRGLAGREVHQHISGGGGHRPQQHALRADGEPCRERRGHGEGALRHPQIDGNRGVRCEMHERFKVDRTRSVEVVDRWHRGEHHGGQVRLGCDGLVCAATRTMIVAVAVVRVLMVVVLVLDANVVHQREPFIARGGGLVGRRGGVASGGIGGLVAVLARGFIVRVVGHRRRFTVIVTAQNGERCAADEQTNDEQGDPCRV